MNSGANIDPMLISKAAVHPHEWEGYQLYMAHDHQGPASELHQVITSVNWEERLKGGCAPQSPPIMLTKEAAQRLMDTLWNAGLRPRDIGTAGHLSATQAHLNDMRRIVEAQLQITFPTT